MNTDILYEFVCLSENLNFTAAAQQCFITQSVLSKHISSLEKELGVSLFIRGRQRVRLTSAGREFASEISVVLEAYEEALRKMELRRRDKIGTLRISFLSGATHSFLRYAYEVFLKKNPSADGALYTAEGSALRSSLEENRAEIAITMVFEEANTTWYRSYSTYDDFYGIIVSNRHELAKQESVTRKDLNGIPLVIPNRKRFRDEWAYLQHNLASAVPDSELLDDIHNMVDFGILPLTHDRVTLAPSHIVYKLDTSRVKFLPLDRSLHQCAHQRHLEKQDG